MNKQEELELINKIKTFLNRNLIQENPDVTLFLLLDVHFLLSWPIYRHRTFSIHPQPPPSDTIFNAIGGNAKNKNWNVRYRQVKLSNGAKINVRYNQVSAIAVSAI